MPRWLSRNRLIGLVVTAVLLVAMVLDTKFLTPEELESMGPVKFDAAQTAADLFEQAQAELPEKADPVGEVINAIQDDPQAAAEEYEAVSATEGSYAFAVNATATVSEAGPDSIQLAVDGIDSETTVIVPLSTAINGTAVRDVMGFKFADAPSQTEYQYVGDELKALMQEKVAEAGDGASLEGQTVEVVGVVALVGATGPPPAAKPVNVQPLILEVTS